MEMTNDYCGQCGLVGGGDALGCTAECESPKGKRLARERDLIDVVRPRIGDAVYVQTTEVVGVDGQDAGRLFAVVTRDGEIVSEDGTLPLGYDTESMERPFGIVGWDSAVSCVALDDIVLRTSGDTREQAS